MKAKSILSFKPKQVSKKLLASLNPRMRDIISSRYGLEKEEKMTLEAIGRIYDVTRERVRQIENFAISQIKKSNEYKEYNFVFEELRNLMRELGSVLEEKSFLNYLSKDLVTQNHINLYLVLDGNLTKIKGSDEFHSHWSVDDTVAKHVKEAIHKLQASIGEEDLLTEAEIINRFIVHLDQLVDEYRNDKEVIHHYLKISKKIGRNALNEWGKSSSPYIKARGIKDYAYLVVRQAGKAMHFREIAEDINRLFQKRAHVATCHNELIKDDKFVLLGRGIYGLKELGHVAGTVKDVIINVLETAGVPLEKSEIVKRVLEKRLVKPNTILVNLQNPKYFKKNKDGKYSLVK